MSLVITSITTDAANYAQGDTITATAQYTDTEATPDTPTLTGTDPDGATASQDFSFTVNQPQPAGSVNWVLNDPSGRVWTEVPGSDTGAQVQFTATA